MATVKKNQAGTKASSTAAAPEITPHTVVKELPLEKVIDNTLAKNNVTKKVLNAMKEKYLAQGEENKLVLKDQFVLKNLTDKETYLIIKEERKGIRKVGIITEDLCKKGRADAIAIQKLWLGKEKEILDEIAIVQDQLDEQIKKYEEEEKRLFQVEEDRKDQQLITRQNELIKMGAVNANGCMNINDLSIENSSIREADDDVYNETILPLFKMHYENNEKVRIAEEEEKKKKQQEFEQQQADMKKQQEEFEQQQQQFKKQQEEFQQQQEELKKQKIKNRCLQLEAIGLVFSFKEDAYIFEDVNVDNKTEVCLLEDAAWEELLQKIKPEIEQRKKDAATREERKTKRAAQLSALGMTFTGTHYIFSDISIPATDLTGMEDNTWNELIATTTPMIDDRKLKAAKLELGNTRMETLKTIGLVKDETVESLSELSKDEFLTLAEKYKSEVAEEKQKEWQRQQDDLKKKQQQQQEEDAARATDKDKWAAFISQVDTIPLPEFKSNVYKSKLASAKDILNQLKSL